MDLIDVDQVLEVPDTPDRLLGPPALRNGDRYRIRRESDDSVINCNNNRVANKDYSCERIRSQEREKEKLNTGKHRLFVRPDSCSKSRVFSTSKNVEQTIDAVRHDKGKALCISDVDQLTCRVGNSYAGLTEKNARRLSGVSRGNDYRKGVLRFNGFSTIDSGSYKLNSSDTVPGVDRGKGVGFFHTGRKDESDASTSLKPCTTSKVPQKRMLVRNGCISPYNVEKLKNVAAKHDIVDLVEEKQSDFGAPASESRSNSIVKANNIPEKREIGRLVREKRSDSGALASGSQSSVVDIKDLIAEAKDSCRFKGKKVSHHPSSEEPAAESSRLSLRRLVSKKPADKSSDYSVATPRCSAETETWRTLHNERKQRDVGQQKIMQIDHRIGRDIDHRDDGVPQVMPPHANKLRINRQREDSASRNSSKRPISCIVDTAAEPSSSRSKRNRNLSVTGTSNPVSEPNSNSADSSIRSLQIEADEMLARELQEQLYAEELAPAVANDEMDIPLAFARPAHQDDNAWGAGGHHSYRRQGTSISNVRGRVQPSTSRHHSFRRLPQHQPHTSTRMAQLRRNFLEHRRSTLSTSNLTNLIFPPNMYAELRLGMQEALEAVADSRMPRDLLQVGREFNEDDYEMLLSLDEDNHQHGGATRAQINNLPESVVQVETSQECAICLEIPNVGETIRHLPCLHRFHKACIDQWLGRKTSCPICKSSIT